jgi:predicted nucleic acid-binding protein
MIRTVIWDAGALIMVERARPQSAIRAVEIRSGRMRAVVPSPILAEVWRGRSDQAHLARFFRLPGVIVDAPNATAARTAGELLHRARQKTSRGKTRPGVVDAFVAECALRYDADAIITGDMTDLEAFDLPIALIAGRQPRGVRHRSDEQPAQGAATHVHGNA